MAHVNRVVGSWNLDGDSVCVDVFQRPDGSYGFALFRRDSEDVRGWLSIGHYRDCRFKSVSCATSQACRNVPWLSDILAMTGDG